MTYKTDLSTKSFNQSFEPGTGILQLLFLYHDNHHLSLQKIHSHIVYHMCGIHTINTIILFISKIRTLPLYHSCSSSFSKISGLSSSEIFNTSIAFWIDHFVSSIRFFTASVFAIILLSAALS